MNSGDERIAALNGALDANDLGLILVALRDIARTRGIRSVARQAGIPRTSLYKYLSITGNPKFATVLKVINVLGVRFQVAAKKD